MTSSLVEDAVSQNSKLSVAMQNITAIRESTLTVSHKAEQRLTVQSRNPTPRYLCKWNKSIYTNEDLYTENHSTFNMNQPQTRSKPTFHEQINNK